MPYPNLESGSLNRSEVGFVELAIITDVLIALTFDICHIYNLVILTCVSQKFINSCDLPAKLVKILYNLNPFGQIPSREEEQFGELII